MEVASVDSVSQSQEVSLHRVVPAGVDVREGSWFAAELEVETLLGPVSSPVQARPVTQMRGDENANVHVCNAAASHWAVLVMVLSGGRICLWLSSASVHGLRGSSVLQCRSK